MRHQWSKPVKGRDKWIETCACGCRRVTEKLSEVPKKHYITYEHGGNRTATAPVCTGPKQQTSMQLV